jgi:lysophospholipase L1-like esterase
MSRLSRKRRFLYISLVYVTFIAVLALLEIAARLFFPPVPSLELFVATSQQTAQVANAQQSGIFEGDPLLLWRLRPNLDRVVWDYTVVSTNAQGFRADKAIEDKQPGRIRIVCLGDSVTFGYRVPPVWPERPTEYDPEWIPYPMLLEKSLRAANPDRNIEVIAMAVPGYTSHQGLAWLRRDIDSLQPDLLIVSFGWNDVSFSEGPDRETVGTSSYLVVLRSVISKSQVLAHTIKWLRRGGRHETGASPEKTQPVPRVAEHEYLGNMQEIVELARSRGSAVVVLAAPYRDSVTNPTEAVMMAGYRQALRVKMQQNKITFLEVTELTEAAYPSNEGWFEELIHPNHMGHRLLAAELLELLSNEGIMTGLSVPKLTP